MAKYINPIKEKFYKQYGHKYGTRENFEQNWKQYIRAYVGKFGFGRTKEKLSNQVSLIMREQILAQEGRYGNKNLFKRIENIETKSATEILNAEKEIYEERTENFREKYGEEILWQNGDDKSTVNDLFEKYKNGEISQNQMNDIIETVKKTSPEYLSTENYNKPNQNTYFK